MSHHRYLAFIGVASLVSWLAWLLVILKLDPFASPGLAMGFFFISFLVALSGTFTVIGFYFRVWLNKNEVFYNHINIAFRQGILLSLMTLGCLGFQLLGVLTWWTGLIFIAAITSIEFYLMSKEG